MERPIDAVVQQVGRIILGKELQVRLALTCLLARGHLLIEDIPGLAPPQRGWTSNRLTADDVTPERSDLICSEFYRQARDRDGVSPS